MPEADYVIIGGGTAGLVVAQRLSKRLPQVTILVIEAGDDPKDNETVKTFSGMNAARETKQSWEYSSNLGPGLNNRIESAAAGKGIGGSALINAGEWLRGSASDWNNWARLVNDNAWSYEEMLPYFRITENVQGPRISEHHHGYDGYLKVFPVKTAKIQYPLREKVLEAWKEAGEIHNTDPNDGSGDGVGESIHVWNEGNRPLPADFLDLNIKIITDSLVQRVLCENRHGKMTAVGVLLADGKRVNVRKEVIVSAGAYQSPKVLELSGIGDSSLLKKFDIDVKVDNPEVGRNLADHFLTTLTWKLRHPEQGLALGSPALTDPAFFHTFPVDFVHHGPVMDMEKLPTLLPEEHTNLLNAGACHIQQWIIYMPFPKPISGVDNPFDGTLISTCTGLVTPTSRGTVHIESSDPKQQPSINKQILLTTADEFMFASGLRRISEVLLNTKAGQSMVIEEIVPEGYKAITPQTSDEDIVARVGQFAWSINHPMGSCAMGKVVDSHCKVKDVEGLRVVDASIIPITPAATIQAAVYAVAERAAEFIASEA